ncbi:MAG TPA: Ig-like domain-containing protein [Ramlibacter sp.]
MSFMQEWAGSGDTRLTGDGQQRAPAVAALAGGGHIVGWLAATGDGSFEVRAQRFDAGGSKLGPELVLNDAPAYGSPGLVALADGGFLATWDSSPSTAPTDYIGRRFAADGAPLGASFAANDTTNPDPTAASVEPTALAGGGFVMHWWANAGAPTWWGPVLQVYDAGGAAVGADKVLASGIGSVAIAPDHDGGFFAVWSGGSGNFLQRFDSAGNALAQAVAIPTPGGFMEAAVLASGDLAVSTLANNSGYWSVMVQRLDSQGQALDAQQALFSLPNSITEHKVTALADGGFLVSWLLSGVTADAQKQLLAQRFDAWGTKVGGEMTVGVLHSDGWPVYSAAATPDGGIVFAWDTTSADPGDIYIEQFVPTGTPVPDESPPVVASFSPPDERYDVPIDANIVVTFNEPIQKGSGTIVLRDSGVVVATYDVASSPQVTVSGNALTIDPDDLRYDSVYSVEFSAGSVTDLAGNAYAGTNTYNFRTQDEPDYTPPQLLWSDPTSGENWVEADDTTLWFRFSESVQAQPTAGPIVLKTGDGAVVAAWDQIAREPMASNWASLTLPAPLSPDTTYRLELPAGAVVDSAGNPLASATIDFRTAAGPQNPDAPVFTPGAADQANTLAAGEQTGPQIARLADGSFFVVWASIPTGSNSTLDSDIRGQMYDASGTKVGGELLLAQDAARPLVAGLEGGGFALTWSGPYVPDHSSTSMFTQRFDGSGQPLGEPVAPNTSSGFYLNPGKTVALDGGGYLVVMAERTGNYALATTEILGQRFDASGAKVGGEMYIGSALSGWDVTSVPGGGWAVATQNMDQRYGGLNEFQTTVFDGSGTIVGTSDSYSSGFNPRLATLANGLVLAGNPSQFEMFDASGAAVVPPADFDLPGSMRASQASIAASPDGGFVATWREVDSSGNLTGNILAQYFDAAARAVGAPVQVPGTAIAATPDGGFLVAFEVANAETGKDVQVQKFEAVTAPPPGDDAVAPSPIDFFPAAGSNTLPPDWSLAITFDEAVQAGAGTITLRTAAGEVVQTFDVASDPGIRFMDRSVVIDPAADLLPGANYQLAVAAGAIEDLAGNAYAGVSGHGFTTAGEPPAGGDPGAPVAVDFFPAAGSNTLPPDWSLAITFDEAVQAGSGTITLQTAGGQVVQTFDAASDPGIRFMDRSVVIDPVADLLPGTSYELVVAPGAIQDLAGNAYSGVSGHSFTTAGEPPAGGDPGAPVAVDFFPAADSNTLPPDWSLAITFNEAVQAGSGTITLQTAGGQVVQTFATATDPGIRFDGSSVIIDPTADLLPGTSYRLIVSAGAVQDLAGNAYAGVSGHSFTTAGSAAPPASDSTAPVAIDFFPAAGSDTLPPDWSLAITFDEAVQAGSGTIVLQTGSGQVVQTFAAASDPGIQFNGASVIIDPSADLQPGTTYQLIVSADAVQDIAGNAYAGVSGYAFSTAGDQVAALVGTADHFPA